MPSRFGYVPSRRLAPSAVPMQPPYGQLVAASAVQPEASEITVRLEMSPATARNAGPKKIFQMMPAPAIICGQMTKCFVSAF